MYDYVITFENFILIDKINCTTYGNFMANPYEHVDQKRMFEMFGENALSTRSGMDWAISGSSNGLEFGYRVDQGGFYYKPDGSIYTGFPWRAAMAKANVFVVDAGIVPNPHSSGRYIGRGEFAFDYAGSPDPDFASKHGLQVFAKLAQRIGNAAEIPAPELVPSI